MMKRIATVTSNSDRQNRGILTEPTFGNQLDSAKRLARLREEAGRDRHGAYVEMRDFTDLELAAHHHLDSGVVRALCAVEEVLMMLPKVGAGALFIRQRHSRSPSS